MFTLPFAAKIGLGAGAGLLLLTAASPAVTAMAPMASRAVSTAAATPPAGASTTDRRADRRVMLGAYLEASATVLGLSDAELRAALKSGKSLSDLAQARGIGKDAFSDRVSKAVAPLLDRAVDAHQITRAQATRFEKRLAAGRLPLWTRDRHRPAPAATPSPAA